MNEGINTNTAFWSSLVISNIGFMNKNYYYGTIWTILAIIFLIGHILSYEKKNKVNEK